MKKIVITGHANGIGKALYSALKHSSDYAVSGYDRAHGKDIEDTTVITEFLSECGTSDYIILNAYTTSYCQHMLLDELFNRYKHTNKVCIAVGSLSTDRCINEEIALETLGSLEYWYNKKSLNDTVTRINKTNSNFKAVIVKPGWVKTQFSQHLHNGPWIDPAQVADAITHIIELDQIWFIPEIHINTSKTRL